MMAAQSVPPLEPATFHHDTEVYIDGDGSRGRCLDCDWHGPRRPIRWDAIGDALEHEDGPSEEPAAAGGGR